MTMKHHRPVLVLVSHLLVNCERLSQAACEIGMCSACTSSLNLWRTWLVAVEWYMSVPYAPDAKSLNARSAVTGMQTVG